MTESINVNANKFLENKTSMKLAELKSIINCPNLFISEYFARLTNDVDMESEMLLLDRKTTNTYKKQQAITKNREVMIDRIKSFESECLNCKEDKLSESDLAEARALIAAVEGEAGTKRSPQELQQTKQLLDSQIQKLKTILFHNKCFLFIKKQEVIDYNSDESVMFGKLLFMNHLFSSKGMETFYEKLNQNSSNTKEINNK